MSKHSEESGGLNQMVGANRARISEMKEMSRLSEVEFEALRVVHPLTRNKETLEQFNTPYLRFHPTLSYAARPHDVPEPDAAAQRFIGVYLKVMGCPGGASRPLTPICSCKCTSGKTAW